jgi:hypothetical protein
MNKREQERVKRAFEWVQKKLRTNYYLSIQETKQNHTLSVITSNRGPDDQKCFIAYYNAKNTKKRTFNDLKRDCFHEILHMLNWKRRDVFEETVRHVRSKLLRKTLTKQFYSCDESINYDMERALGPHIIAKWKHDDP